MSLSPSQLAVLRWLVAYPGITIYYSNPPDGFLGWSASWRSEAARQHMCSVIGALGADGSFSTPRLAGGTESGTP